MKGRRVGKGVHGVDSDNGFRQRLRLRWGVRSEEREGSEGSGMGYWSGGRGLDGIE